MPILAERLHTHHLTGPGLPGPLDVVRRFGAMQAQDFPGVLWAMAQRVSAARRPTEADLRADFDAGVFLRTHVLRPTWHIVSASDLRWLIGLSGPRVQAANRPGYRRLGFTGAEHARAERVFLRTLGGGHAATRHELGEALQRARLRPDGQRLVYFLMHAELEGLLCSGPLRGAQHTYMLFDDRVPASPPMARDEALTRLITTYFTAHGPATVGDCVWWSGLPARDVREGIALAGGSLARRPLGAREYFSAADHPIAATAPRRCLHLLSNFDEYMVGYRDRTALLHRDTPATTATQLALLSQPVLAGGRQAGTWRRRLLPETARRSASAAQTGRARVAVTVAWRTLAAAGAPSLRTTVARYAHFLGRDATLVVTGPTPA